MKSYMNKIFLSLFVLLILSSNSFSQFRDSEWGQTKNQVKKTEKSQPTEETEDKLLFYEQNTLLGMNSYIEYDFLDNKLYMTQYMFDSPGADYSDFLRLKNLLIEKYGKNKEGDDPLVIATWETEDTLINLMLLKEYKLLGITYRSIKYQDFESERDKRKL